MAKAKKVQVKKVVAKKVQVVSKKPDFEVKELDGVFAIELSKPTKIGDIIKVTFKKDEGEVTIETEAVENHQVVFSLPEKLDVIRVEVIKADGEVYKVTMTVNAISYISEDKDLQKALLAFPYVKICGKTHFLIELGKKKREETVMFPFQAKRILSNKIMAMIFADRIKPLIK
jgi:hypothetical protein